MSKPATKIEPPSGTVPLPLGLVIFQSRCLLNELHAFLREEREHLPKGGRRDRPEIAPSDE